MSQLTITSYYIRKGVKIGIVLLLLFFISKTGINVGIAYWKKMHPPPEPPPDTVFGKLPAINFPDNNQVKPKNFILETISSGLPTDLPDRIKVYFIPQVTSRFFSLDKAKAIAQKLGFNDKPQKLSESLYFFSNATTQTSLEINVLTENFKYQYSYLTDQKLLNPNQLSSGSDAISIAENFLNRIGKMSDQLSSAEAQTTYWEVKTNKLVQASSVSEADFTRIDIPRKKINQEYEVMPPDINNNLVNLLISGKKIQSSEVVQANYTFFAIDTEKVGTYPLKTIQQAWEELQRGQYYLANPKFTGSKKAKIRRIYLAYFNPVSFTEFLQPIYVFQGDNDFYGYVPAVAVEWIK